ncbi:ABC transporter permease [Micromonospora sp. NPDC047707]|uniref:ABC transporter permease n=1 Tax=Micromonospora sp. NPDC047707 TaxID=3154498 RepID=UPI0034516009
MPVVVLVLCALIFGAGGDDWPVAIVDDAKSKRSAAIVDSIEDSRSRITPYFRIVEEDSDKADQMINDGRLQLKIHIPADFEATNRIYISTYNINSDATKNLRMRVTNALNAYDVRDGRLPLSVDLRTVESEDVPRTAFIAGGVLLLALFFGAALIAANLFALEHEERTSKVILLSPIGPAGAAIGAMVTGTMVAFLTAVPTYLIGWLAFGLAPEAGAILLVLLFMIPLMFACAGVGVLLAQMLRVHRNIQPLIILTCIATFFAAGGFVSVGGLPPAARGFAAVWPLSRVFEWNNPVLHQFVNNYSTSQWVWVWIAAVVGLLAGFFAGYRERLAVQQGGQ